MNGLPALQLSDRHRHRSIRGPRARRVVTTNLSSIEIMQAELGSALYRWALSPDASLRFISHSENTTFLARDLQSGQRLVLRVQRIGYHTPAEILSELSWIAALIADAVIDTPRPLPDRDGLLLCPVPLNGSMRQVVAGISPTSPRRCPTGSPDLTRSARGSIRTDGNGQYRRRFRANA